MNRSKLAIASLWPLGFVLAVVLPAGTAEGQTQQWTKYAGNPVLEHGEPGDCDEGVVDHSEVLFDGVMYHMWYAGGPVVHDTDICYATSTDGVHWDKWPNPVLLRGAPGEWDAGFVQPGAVLWDGGLYHMWYGACVSSDTLPCQTGYATSEDGLAWTKHPDNPVLPVGNAGTWDSSNALITAVVADGGGFRAWYWGYVTLNWMSIGYATSPDGVTWTKYAGNPVFWPRTRGWDRLAVAFPMVVQDGGVYRMWYSVGYCGGFGHAVSVDGINWARQPLWEPVLPSGGPTDWDWCVFSSRLVLEGDTAHMWYNGVNSQDVYAIGYATAPLPFPEAWVFVDDFESGDTSTWSATVP
jgi:beta-1,2-mannobiose phosphorylase / 1,2-beta-oligomannan phosphorylase